MADSQEPVSDAFVLRKAFRSLEKQKRNSRINSYKDKREKANIRDVPLTLERISTAIISSFSSRILFLLFWQPIFSYLATERWNLRTFEHITENS